MVRDWVGMMITCDNILCTWLGNTRDSHFFVHAQNLPKLTCFSNTLFLSTFCVLALEQRRLHPKIIQHLTSQDGGHFFPPVFSFNSRPLVLQSGFQRAGAPEICHVGEQNWIKHINLEKFTARLYLPFLNFSEVQIFDKLYLQQSAQVSHTIYIPLPRPVEYFRSSKRVMSLATVHEFEGFAKH